MQFKKYIYIIIIILFGCVKMLKCLLDCMKSSSVMKSTFSMDESFTLSDMIRLLLQSSFGQQVSNHFSFLTFI